MREVSPLLLLLFVLLANLPPSSTVSPLNFGLSPPSHAVQQLLRRRDVADQQEAAAPGLSSLTFVFDRTGSMNDDLNQVRQGAKGIFETVMKQRKKFIFNYVLVLFHDPEVDPPFITTDPDMFQQQLASVSVQGGGDCPEMTLSGIKKALEVSLPGSFIYVFTDARSKDYHLEEAVLNLIQEKQSSVVFVMTGDCGNRSAPGYKVFERIAAASFGQVFHLEKSHVNTVLEYVRHAVSQRKVHILYEVREHGQTHTTLVPVDAFVSELTLSLAGERDDGAYLSIALVDPQNRTIEKSDYEREQGTIDLTNVKLIRIKNPLPGVWRVRTSSRLKHTLRIFGHGTIDFKYGFASRPVASVDLTHPRPIAGQITYLVVNTTGLNPPGTVVQISLVDYHGKELYRNESQADPDSFSVFFVGPFIPPKGFFFVRVNGEDEMNYEFVRIAPTAISTVEVVGPRAFMAERHTAHAYKSINLSCSIESRASYTVFWLFGGKAIGGPLFYDSTDTSIWTIDAVTSAHRGLYTCQVISPQGNHSAMTFLDSRESPPHIIAIRNESVIIHGTAFLHCRTQSIEEPKIFWVHNQSKTLGNSAKAYTFGNNGTLRILDTTVDDSGDYTCRARTSGGQSEAVVWLHVLQAPRVRVRPSEKWVASGSTFNLSCATEGRPQPEVIWFFKGARIVPDPKFFITYKGDLIVSEVDEDDKGIYECRATNSVGKASDFAKVHLALPPSIEVSQNKQMIVRGDLLVLDCRAISGVPTPKIHWFKDGRQLTSDRFLHIQEGRLTIRNADESDAGTYACKAENLAGSEIKPITLGIGSAPTIMAGPDSVFGYIQRTVTILCRAIGVPKPQVRWLMNGEPIGEGGGTERFVHLPDDSLLIKDVQTTDEATFTCVARNEFGEQLKHTNLVVIGLVRPVLAVLPARMELIEGKELQINCIVLLGIPHPKTHWLKNDRSLSSADDQRAVVLPDGSLLIKNGSEEDAGHFSCHAESSAGNATVEVDVELIMKPTMALSVRLGPSGDEDVVAKKGAQLDIECPVKVPLGQEQPKVLWTLDFVPLNVNSPDFALLPNHSLRIHKVSNDHAGRYTCTAINQAGEAAKSTFVRVHTQPTIALGQSSFNLIRGDTVIFPCDVEGEPKPIVKWFLNGEALVDGLVEEDGSLALEAVEDRHRGTFTCVAENELGRDERIISLAVHSAPIIEGKGIVRELVANESDWLELRCPATAHPPPKRRWNWNGLRIDLRDGERGAAGAAPSGHSVHLEMPSNGSLVIRKVALAHAGAYECHVSNMAGEDRLHYSLKVQTPPRIISDSTEKVIFTSVGTSRDLLCFAEGVPEPTLSWEKDHLPVLPNNFSFIDPKGTLRFRHILLDDAGEYICRVKNPAGEATRNVRIVVQVPPYAQDGQINEYTFIEDELADLFCLVDGDPKPDIQWLWQDNPLDMNSSRYATFGDGNLRIVNVRASDDGFYTCRATNRAGKEDLVIRVVVISPPEMRDPESAEFLSSLVGNPVILQCPLLVSKPSPLPNIQWTFNGTQLPSESLGIAVLLSEDRRRLRVPKATVEHSGEYKCVAENAAGEAEKRFIVDVMEPPRFKDTSNTRYSVIEGRTVMLSCQADGTPQPTILWRKDGAPLLVDGEHFQMLDDGQQLHIEEMDERHVGRYSCIADNLPGRAEKDIVVSLIRAPEGGGDTTLEVAEKGTQMLECPLLMDSPADTTTIFHWTKNSVPVTQNIANIQLSTSARRLHLVRAQASDAGLYTCTAKNAAGEANATFTVVVLVPPSISDGYRTLETLAGQIVQLECHANGMPTPEIKWTHNGLPLVPSDRIQLLNNDSLLHIESVQLSSDAGRYSCAATNKVGRVEMDLFLDVIEPPKIAILTPELNVVEGRELRLECNVLGTPVPKVEWRKGGSELLANLGVHVAFAPPHSHHLHIHSAAQEHGGRYTCIATNKGGEVRENIQLKVLVPPTISDGERLLRMVEGANLTLQCPAHGVPTPQIVWRKGMGEGQPKGKELLATDEVDSLGRSKVLLRSLNLSDSGRYTCEATNEAGKTSADFIVEVQMHPRIVPSPSNFQVKVVEGDRARMECLPEGNPTPTVKWLKAGRALTDMSNVILSPRGDALMLLKSRRTDAGSYTCVLENSAGTTDGTFSVDVLIGPHINETLDQNPHVLMDQDVVLPCPVQGLPIPTVQWLKNGQLIADGGNFVGEGPTDIRLEKVGPADAGRYTCRASNEVGQLNTDFELEVIAPPQFLKEGPRNFEAVEGQSVTMACPIEATSFTDIAWTHGTEPVDATNARFSGDNKRLTLPRVTLSDGGKYVCRASNLAGHTEADLSLRVLIPPRIDKSNMVNNPLAILGKEIFMECPAFGIPQPTIIWKKGEAKLMDNDGRIVFKQGNQTLGIRGVSLSDQQENYSCEVENKVGKLREEFRLEVLVPPEMEQSTEEFVSRREGELLELVCPLKSDTLAAADELRVVWAKDGRPLESNPNIEMGGEHPWLKLVLRDLLMSDAGQYKCVASNRAGQSFHKFDVDILSKPLIDLSRNGPEPHVIAGRAITLWCPASGNPLPTVRWFLNGVDITPQSSSGNGRYRLLDQGQGLEIQPSAPKDAGLWTCQAENRAGTSTADISLDVWVEPTVRVLVEDNAPIKPIGEAMALLCEVHGNPEPVTSWSLREQTLLPTAGKLHISKGAQRLEIARLRIDDAGDYYCIAQNEVGSATDFVSVDILVPPSISRESAELNPRLPLGRSLTLFCDVIGKPPPSIRWTKNGTNFRGGENVQLGEGNRSLHIQNISLTDRGVYRCEATNRAGNDSVEYRLDVFQAPIIVKGGTEQVVDGKVAVLECVASGEPPPLISWQRNGVLVEMGVRYALEASQLKVIDTRSSDSGIYVCVATNEAGTDQQAFTLEVLVPPKLVSDTPVQVAVSEGGTATLECKSRGYPAPQVIWSVESRNSPHFHPIGTILKRNVQYELSEDGQTLQLFGLSHESTRHFRCSAINNAGMDQLEFGISIIRAPFLSREGVLALNVTEGGPLLIPCGVKGTGKGLGDQVHWTHNGKLLTVNEQLSFAEVTTAQGGNYTCTVKNAAGNASSTVVVHVGVAPKISEDGKHSRGRVIVEKGATAELWCESVGIPKPKISWFRDDQPLKKFAPTAFTANEGSGTVQSMDTQRSTAIFGDVQPEHSGVYTCVAENWAGKVNKTVDLVVLIPPSISPERDQTEVESGQMAVLHCNATGIPEPLVSWVKAEEPPVEIVANERKYQLLGTSLAIREVDKNDDGFYHCVARSEAGQAIGFRRVLVKLPMSDLRRIYVECDTNGIPVKNSYVRARGDRPKRPNDYIHWGKEEALTELPKNGTDGTLVVCLPESDGFEERRRRTQTAEAEINDEGSGRL